MAKDMVKNRTGGSQASAAELYDFMKKVLLATALGHHHSFSPKPHITPLKGGHHAVSPESCKGSPRLARHLCMCLVLRQPEHNHVHLWM